MPDDFDYASFGEFLERAESWSQEDLETARFLLANQRRAVRDSHQRDRRSRRALQDVADALERAIDRHSAR
jgi:hypothetical protein